MLNFIFYSLVKINVQCFDVDSFSDSDPSLDSDSNSCILIDSISDCDSDRPDHVLCM